MKDKEAQKGIAQRIEGETKGGYLRCWQEYSSLLTPEQQWDYFLILGKLILKDLKKLSLDRDMKKPKLLDLFCGAGGASMGYYRAGFEVAGVDIKPQPHYPFKFYQADALEFPLEGYDAYSASPPCQGYIYATTKYRNQGKIYPLLVGKTRDRIIASGLPFVIEEPVAEPLLHPIRLCGVMFGLKVIRHRYFESNIPIPEPIHIKHNIALYDGSAEAVWSGGYNPGGWGDPGRKKRLKSQYYCVVGRGGDSPDYKLESWRNAMDIDWMTKYELTQAIPPAYTEYIGKYLLKALGI